MISQEEMRLGGFLGHSLEGTFAVGQQLPELSR